MWSAVFRIFSSGLGAISGGLASAGKAAASFGNIFNNSIFKSITAANALNKALGALQAGFHGALQSAKQFSNLSLRLGMKPSEVASLSQMANDAGVSLMILGRAVMQVEKFGAQAQFNKKFKDINKILGLTNEELMALKQNGAEGLAVIAERYQEIGDEQQQMQVLQAMHGGRGAMQMKAFYERDPEEIRKGITQYASSDETIRTNARMEEVISNMLNKFKVVGQELMAMLEPLLGLAIQIGAQFAIGFATAVKLAADLFDVVRSGLAELENWAINTGWGEWLFGKLYGGEGVSKIKDSLHQAAREARVFEQYRKEARAESLAKMKEELSLLMGKGVGLLGGNPFEHLMKPLRGLEVRFAKMSENDLMKATLETQVKLNKLIEDRMSAEQRIASVRTEGALKQLETEKKISDLKAQDDQKFLDAEEKEKKQREERERKLAPLRQQLADLERTRDEKLKALDKTINPATGLPMIEERHLTGAGQVAGWTASTVGFFQWAADELFDDPRSQGYAERKSARESKDWSTYALSEDLARLNSSPQLSQNFWIKYGLRLNALEENQRREIIQRYGGEFQTPLGPVTASGDITTVKETIDKMVAAGEADDAALRKNLGTDTRKMSTEEWLARNADRKEVRQLLEESKYNIQETAIKLDVATMKNKDEQLQNIRFDRKLQQAGRPLYLAGVEQREGKLARLEKEMQFQTQEVGFEYAELKRKIGERAAWDEDLKRRREEVAKRNELVQEALQQPLPVSAGVGTGWTDANIKEQRERVLASVTELQSMMIQKAKMSDQFSLATGDSMRAVGGGGNVAAGPVSVLSDIRDLNREMRDYLQVIALGMGLKGAEASKYVDEGVAVLSEM